MTSEQYELNLTPVKHTAPEGIEMGVMADGSPYLGARGLALLCGVAPSNIITLVKEWETLRDKPRGRAIERIIKAQDGDVSKLYIPIQVDGVNYHAINDINCMAILEYYAFDSQSPSVKARDNYRLLAKQTLKKFIYEQTGYRPSDDLPRYWKVFHERVSLNDIPSGYFSVFREIANLLVTAIQKGVPLDEKTVPDISVGLVWAKHWKDNGLEEGYGQRIRHIHKFPDDFPQIDPKAWIYPVEALGEFRKWLDDVYISEKFQTYLNGKAKSGQLGSVNIEALVNAVQPHRLDSSNQS
ncbi:hypothetical protein [Methylophaga muralis]|uniref:BstA-like C-terminal domain-containing protein n=1 Tax=Methylophaga muralis TaxID=291169 RepID=A0A1E3GNT6_9GAMM|nr:hypothetical protein [Methylophaga muralis]ODN65690.1 hypothetical protein A9E74_02536 [Methylophaga muralis]